jgi:hypothetical protein
MRYREIKAEITEIIAACSEIYIKHVNEFWGHKVQGAYKLSEYFAKPDDRCILCNEIVNTTF